MRPAVAVLLVLVGLLCVAVSAGRLRDVADGASFVETGASASAAATAEMRQVAEDKSTTDELLNSILPAEARSLAQTHAKMLKQMRETQNQLAALEDDSGMDSRLAAQFAHFKAKRARVLAEIAATTDRVNRLSGRSNKQPATMIELAGSAAPVPMADAADDTEADSLEMPGTPDVDLSSATAVPVANPSKVTIERAHYLFPVANAGTLDCMCALMPGVYDESVHSALHRVEDKQKARECSSSDPPAPAPAPVLLPHDDDDLWVPVPDASGHIKPVDCFDGCQKSKCKPVFKSRGFDAYHECLLSCVKVCYKGNALAMKVAEDAVQVQAEVTGKVKKAMRDRLFDSESYVAKHLH